MEKISKLLKQTESESSTDESHLRPDDYLNHPKYHCAYCDKTHFPKDCKFLERKKQKKEEANKPQPEPKPYSWYM
jgi:type IV secretory pathway VirD2 relaxase